METLKEKATLENLDMFLRFVKQFTQKEGFDTELSSELELVAEEVIVNVVNYAYPQEKGDVEITLSMNDNIFSFCVVDQGVPFDMTLAEDPDITLSIEEKEIGGMGIFFVKHIMDEIRYERKENKNILTLAKRI
jgi:serine/threonine-protein kinase RsbW